MDYVKAQEDLLAAMESWRDVTMAPDDPNQPHTFQQAKQQYNYIQDYLKNQQPLEGKSSVYDALIGDPQHIARTKQGIGGLAHALGSSITEDFEGGFRTIPIPRGLEQAPEAEQRAYQQAEWDSYSPGKQDYLLRAYKSDARPGGGIPWLGPLFGAAWNTDVGQSIGHSIKDWGSTYAAQQQEILDANRLTPREYEQPSFIPGVRRGSLASGAESLLPMATGIGAGLLTRSPGVGLATMIAPMAGTKFEEEIAAGTPSNVAQDRMERQALYEAMTELFTVFPVLKFGKPIFGRILQTVGTEALGESLTAAAEMMDDYVAKGIEPTKEEVVQRLWESAAIGGALGGVVGTPVIAAQELIAPRPPELNDRIRSLAAKEAQSIAKGLPFGGMVNIVMGDVEATGSAEMIPDVEGQGEQVNINIDNLIRRSDGTRSGIRAQLMEDLAHELGGHQWVQQMITENPNFVAEAFKANEDLILAWQKKSQYQDFGDTSDNILYEEWAAHFAEMDTKVLRRIELAIVNHLQKLIGKDATAKLIKSWDARNITMRNIAKEHLRQLKEKGAAGEVQPVQTITAEQSEALARPDEDMDVTLRTVVEEGLDMPDPELQRATRQRESRGNIQDEIEAQDDQKRVPQKWQELDTPELQALTESNRAKDNPIWVAQNKELENRKAAEQEADTDAELYVDTVDEIMSIYDEDATAAEAAADGTLNDRIISYAAETPFTREELWDGVNQRIEEAAEDTAPPARRFSRARKPKSETVQRDINEEKGKVNKRILASNVDEAEKEVRTKLLKRLQTVMGAPARKRGIEAGDQDVFKERAAQIEAGELDVVEEFIAPFEAQMQGTTERAYKAGARRAQRAKREGKTDAEILKYRPKGAKHPMEGKMTYPFAMEEIDRQEAAGEITSEEAEIRRRAVNNVRRIFKGKAGPTVKRTITEAVYGIGSYEDLVPWSEVYTEEQTTEMGERAEIGQAEARRTRYDPTKITDQQKKDLVEADVTAEEEAWIASDEMPELTTREERLLFLRSPTEFKSETEEKELNDFRAALKERKPYDQKKEAEKREQEKEEVVSKAMAEGKWERLPPEDITKLTDYQRSVVNIEPTQWDRIVIEDEADPDTAFEIYGDAYTEQGELISDMEILDPIGVEPKRRQSVSKTPQERIDGQLKGLSQRNIDSGGFFADQLSRARALISKLSRAAGKVLNTRPYNQLAKEVNQFEIDFPDSEVKMKSFFNEVVKQAELKPWQIVRAEQIGLSKTLKEAMASQEDATAEMKIYDIIDTLNETTGITWSPDHIVSLNTGGLDFAWNLMPLPKSINEKLKHISIEDSKSPAVKAFFDYLINRGNRTDTVYLLIDAAAAAGLINEAQVANAKESLKDTKFPESPILPSFLHGKKGMERLLATYDLHKIVNIERGDPGVAAFEMSSALPQAAEAEHKQTVRRQSIARNKDKDYTEHFNDGFWYTITSFLWGKPVQAIRDFNKSSRFGSKQGKITAADKIADLIQRAHSSAKRAEGLELGTDMMQDISMRSGEFFTKLSRIFALATGRAGDIDPKTNKQLVDYLLDRKVKFSNPQVREAAIELKALVESVYKYGRDSTSNLKERLNLRGEGDTILPRVWNIEYIATRKGKADFLRVVNSVLRARKDLTVTPEELYEAVINSGGFVQGDWTNVKADQTRTAKDIERDALIAEVLDTLPTSSMIDENLVIDDLQALLPRFIQKAIERTEYSRRFGKSDELLRGMIDEALEQIRANNREVLKLGENKEGLMHIDEKKFTKTVWDMARILRNQYGYDIANMPTRKWLQRATNTETLLKLPFVTLASIPEFFTPMLKGDVRPDKWFVDFMAGTAWAGYKGMNGLSKLIFNKHLPAMRKASKDIGGMGIISDVQLLRELGIADIQAMGDLVATRYANPNFARGGLRAGAKGTIAAKVPKKVRAVFNMQTYMQGTLLTTITEMQQLMALRNFQRHMGRRIQFVHKNKGKPMKGRRARLMKQFTQDLRDYGITGDIDLDTAAGQAEFNAGALRFVDQVITRPNDATTAKAFKNPLTAPLVLFKRFITTYGNTLMTSIGNDFATKTSNVERAKQVAQVASVAMVMYGSVMFAEIIRGVLKGDLDEEDFKLIPKDFAQFMRRIDRTGLLTAPGAAMINLTFPYKRGWWDTTQSRIMNEVLGPLGGDLTALGDALISGKKNAWERLFGQVVPSAKPLMRGKTKKKKRVGPGYN